MRMTIRLDDPLLAEWKNLASDTRRSLTQVVEDALRETLARRKCPKRRTRVKLTTFKGRGLQPGADLDDSASLLDRVEGRDAADRR